MHEDDLGKFPHSIVDLAQLVFAGRMYKIVVKDCGFVSRCLYKMVSPILSERSRRKMNFIGTDLVTGVPGTFNPEFVPVAYGGTCTKSIEELCAEFDY